MKFILFGYGSIGQRHFANLKALRPECEIYRSDPPKGMRIIDAPDRYDAAIIATPTSQHRDDMAACAFRDTPFYVEKPLGTRLTPHVDRSVVGFQYRFHHAMPDIRKAARKTGVLHFMARDNLLDRYGPDVAGIMAAHPIDTALWLLGEALEVALTSDGTHMIGRIEHERGRSTHDYQIDKGPRVSTVTSGKLFELDADNQMYLDALRAWVEWLEGGKPDERSCTLEQGAAVEAVLRKVKHAIPA